MPEVRITVEDRQVTKNGRTFWSHAELCMYPAGVVAKQDNKHRFLADHGVKNAGPGLPDYAIDMLLAGKQVRITKKNKAYESLMAEYAKTDASKVKVAAGKPAAKKAASKKVIARTVAENLEIIRMLATPEQLDAFVDSLNV